MKEFWQARQRLTLDLLAAEARGDIVLAGKIAREIKLNYPSPKKILEDFAPPALRVFVRSFIRTFTTFGFFSGIFWRLKNFFGMKNRTPACAFHCINLAVPGKLLLGGAPFVADIPPQAFETTLMELKNLLAPAQKMLIISLLAPEEYYDKKGAILRVNHAPLAASFDYQNGIEFLRLSTLDHSFTDSMSGAVGAARIADVKNILAKIHAALLAGNIVYVHCWAGQERSATLVVAYLMSYHNFTKQDALAKVHRERPYVKDHLLPEQEEFLRVF